MCMCVSSSPFFGLEQTDRDRDENSWNSIFFVNANDVLTILKRREEKRKEKERTIKHVDSDADLAENDNSKEQ